VSQELDLTKFAEDLGPHGLTYLEGFVKQCADAGIDPEPMLKEAQGFWAGQLGALKNIGKGIGNIAGGSLSSIPGISHLQRGGAYLGGMFEGGHRTGMERMQEAGRAPGQQMQSGVQQVAQGAGATAPGLFGRWLGSLGGPSGQEMAMGAQLQTMTQKMRQQRLGQQQKPASPAGQPAPAPATATPAAPATAAPGAGAAAPAQAAPPARTPYRGRF
jgi:hypothetical protein